jgi:2-oxo-3-hexenedioate decarboxylase
VTDLDSAYAAQWKLTQTRLDGGEQLAGAAVGITRAAEQEQAALDGPVAGWVTTGMLAPYGAPVDVTRPVLVQPELALLLGRDLDPPATLIGVLAATEAVFGALRVVEDVARPPADLVADNLGVTGFRLGSGAAAPAGLGDLRLVGCVLRVAGEVVSTAAGAASLGHPAAGAAWLAEHLAGRGQRLRAGWLVFSGGLTAPVPLPAGAVVTAEFDGLGTVEAYGA